MPSIPTTPAQTPGSTACALPTQPGAPLTPVPPSMTNPDIGPLMQENAPSPVGTPGVPPPGRRGYGRTPGPVAPGTPQQ